MAVHFRKASYVTQNAQRISTLTEKSIYAFELMRNSIPVSCAVVHETTVLCFGIS